MAEFVPPSKQPRPKLPVLAILTLIMAVVAIPVTVRLTLTNQDIRNQAAQTDPCRICMMKECYQVANPPFCNADLNECEQDNQCELLSYKQQSATSRFDTSLPNPTPQAKSDLLSTAKSFFQSLTDNLLKLFKP